MSTICADGDAICTRKPGTIARPASVALRLKQVITGPFRWIMALEEKRLSRIALSELTDDQLDDIGLTPAVARREASQSFWN